VHNSCACPMTVIAWRLSGLTLTELWCRHLELGSVGRPALAAYLGGTADWPDTAHNVLAQALNEALWDIGCASLAPLRDDDGQAGPASSDCWPRAAGTQT
jgi:hypothetical protein